MLDLLHTIDNGNSHPHVACFEKDELIWIRPLSEWHYSKGQVIASSVGPHSLNSLPLIDWRKYFQDNFFLSMPVHYEEGLGDDRLVQARYLYELYPGEYQLLIDAGTFVTIDIIGPNGFEGGLIFPGLKNYLSLYPKGFNLPLISSSEVLSEQVFPHSTNEAISQSYIWALKGLIQKISEQFPLDRALFSGGQGGHMANLWEHSSDLPRIKTKFDPHFIHKSLNFIALSVKNYPNQPR
jgi:type III pantothenate kinase